MQDAHDTEPDHYVPDIIADNFVADFKLTPAPDYDDVPANHPYDERARAHFYAADQDLFWPELNRVHKDLTGHNLDVCLGEPHCSAGVTKSDSAGLHRSE